MAKEIATGQGKPQSTLAMKLRKANRKFECKRNSATKIEDVSADGSKWLKHMTKIHGRLDSIRGRGQRRDRVRVRVRVRSWDFCNTDGIESVSQKF